MNVVLLDNVEHQALRVDPARGAALGDAVMYALTYPAEFRNVQAEYPIVFARGPDGAFRPLALFGLREGQNLFLAGDHWDATYLPHAIERQPFAAGESSEGPMLMIDLDSPRVGRGQPVFREHGGMSGLLERISSVLLSLHDGVRNTPAFIAALQRYDLLEPFVFDIALADGTEHRLAGFHTIDEERLSRLGADAFAALGTAGHLEPIYMALASLANLRKLVERQNRAIAGR